MSDLVEINYRLLAVLPRLGINIGFGEKTVSRICRETGVDPAAFILICNMYSYQGYMPTEEALEAADPQSVLKYLHNSHSFYVEDNFRELECLMDRLVAPCSASQKKIILDFFDGYRKEVENHFDYEEQTLFPYVRAMLDGTADGSYTIAEFREQHSNIEEKLEDLKNIVLKYLPENCDSELAGRVLMQLFSLAEDLDIHTAIENNILVPVMNMIENNGAAV